MRNKQRNDAIVARVARLASVPRLSRYEGVAYWNI